MMLSFAGFSRIVPSSLVVCFALQIVSCQSRVYFNDFNGTKGSFKEQNLRQIAGLRLDLNELSGLTRVRNDQCAQSNCIAAIGDRSHTILKAVIARVNGAFKLSEEFKLAVDSGFIHGESFQWEAIGSDAAGRIYVLSESKGTVNVFDKKLDRQITRINLRLPQDVNSGGHSGGEGFLLLARYHFLIAFEKDPMLFVEFGPAGEYPVGLQLPGPGEESRDFVADRLEYVALRQWRPSRGVITAMNDISDLVPFGGNIYVLSDQSRVIARVQQSKGRFDTFETPSVWKLSRLEGKPEGLTFLDDGSPVVVVDSKDASAENLFVFESIGGN